MASPQPTSGPYGAADGSSANAPNDEHDYAQSFHEMPPNRNMGVYHDFDAMLPSANYYAMGGAYAPPANTLHTLYPYGNPYVQPERYVPFQLPSQVPSTLAPGFEHQFSGYSTHVYDDSQGPYERQSRDIPEEDTSQELHHTMHRTDHIDTDPRQTNLRNISDEDAKIGRPPNLKLRNESFSRPRTLTEEGAVTTPSPTTADAATSLVGLGRAPNLRAAANSGIRGASRVLAQHQQPQRSIESNDKLDDLEPLPSNSFIDNAQAESVLDHPEIPHDGTDIRASRNGGFGYAAPHAFPTIWPGVSGEQPTMMYPDGGYNGFQQQQPFDDRSRMNEYVQPRRVLPTPASSPIEARAANQLGLLSTTNRDQTDNTVESVQTNGSDQSYNDDTLQNDKEYDSDDSYRETSKRRRGTKRGRSTVNKSRQSPNKQKRATVRTDKNGAVDTEASLKRIFDSFASFDTGMEEATLDFKGLERIANTHGPSLLRSDSSAKDKFLSADGLYSTKAGASLTNSEQKLTWEMFKSRYQICNRCTAARISSGKQHPDVVVASMPTQHEGPLVKCCEHFQWVWCPGYDITGNPKCIGTHRHGSCPKYLAKCTFWKHKKKPGKINHKKKNNHDD